MKVFVRAAMFSDLPLGRGRRIFVEDHAIALFRDGDSARAFADRCPHAGGSLGDGWVEDGECVCPLHRWRFRLADGACTTIRGEWARVFRCEVREGWVWVEIDRAEA